MRRRRATIAPFYELRNFISGNRRRALQPQRDSRKTRHERRKTFADFHSRFQQRLDVDSFHAVAFYRRRRERLCARVAAPACGRVFCDGKFRHVPLRPQGRSQPYDADYGAENPRGSAVFADNNRHGASPYNDCSGHYLLRGGIYYGLLETPNFVKKRVDNLCACALGVHVLRGVRRFHSKIFAQFLAALPALPLQFRVDSLHPALLRAMLA